MIYSKLNDLQDMGSPPGRRGRCQEIENLPVEGSKKFYCTPFQLNKLMSVCW